MLICTPRFPQNCFLAVITYYAILLFITSANEVGKVICDRYCFVYVCLSVCLSASWQTNEPISLKFGDTIAQEPINFWWRSGDGYGFWIPQHCRIGYFNFRRFVRILMNHRSLLMKIGEMSDTDDRRDESTTFWERSGGYPKSESIRKSGFEFRITFDWGNQSSRGQVHLALECPQNTLSFSDTFAAV